MSVYRIKGLGDQCFTCGEVEDRPYFIVGLSQQLFVCKKCVWQLAQDIMEKLRDNG